MKKISVIVPVYNVEKYLEKSINSIINQTYKNLEIILIEDGSPDSCAVICDELAKKDNRIKVIHKKNEGLANARNDGLDIATGDYISFIDSDDIIDTDMFELLVKLIEENNADISICKYKIITENSKAISQSSKSINQYQNINFNKSETIIKYNSSQAISCLLTGKLTSHMWNKLYKKEIWNNFRFLPNVLYEDIIAMPQLFDKANLIVESKNECYGYLKRKDSITGNVNENIMINHAEAVDKRCEFIEKNYPELKNETFAYKTNEAVCLIGDIARTKRKELLKCDVVKQRYSIFKANYKSTEYMKYLKKQSFFNKIFRKNFGNNIYIAYISFRVYYMLNRFAKK